MFDFSVIPMAFRMGTQNCTSRFHKFSNLIPISTWDTSMNLWLNSLIIHIQIIIFNEGQNCNQFSCSISVISMAVRMGTQNCTSRFHNFSYWSPILTCHTSMSLFLNSLTFYTKSLLFDEGQNFNPFPCSIFPHS